MNDDEIEKLKAALDDGNNGKLYWTLNNIKWHKIVRIGIGPTHKDGDVPEPTEVAWSDDGTYIALDPAELNAFYLIRPVSDLFE